MNRRVLIVDDSRLARMAVSRARGELVPEWPRVEAACVDEALFIVEQAKADIVPHGFPDAWPHLVSNCKKQYDPTIATCRLQSFLQINSLIEGAR